MSRPFTFKMFFFIPSTSNTDIPMGFGLTGEQMLKTPSGFLRWGGVCVR